MPCTKLEIIKDEIVDDIVYDTVGAKLEILIIIIISIIIIFLFVRR